jgi:hypothetical protein
MSFNLVIEGQVGAQRVQQGALPRRGEWLSVELQGSRWWLPVLEVAHVLSRARKTVEPGAGWDLEHEDTEALVYSSLALAVKAEARHEDDTYKLLLPPTRWPYGGQDGNQNATN